MTDESALDPLYARDHAAQNAADATRDAENEDARFRRWERVGTERIHAYAEAIAAIGELLYPGAAADELTRRRRPTIDSLVKGELELALKAMATDIKRLAGQTGPKAGGAEGF